MWVERGGVRGGRVREGCKDVLEGIDLSDRKVSGWEYQQGVLCCVVLSECRCEGVLDV